MEPDLVIRKSDVMGLRKRLVNKDGNINGSPSRHKRPTVSILILNKRTGLVAAIGMRECILLSCSI